MKKIFLLFSLFLISSSALSQNLPADLSDWYLFTNDDNRLYVAEGGEGAESDSVIVLHGGFGAEYSYMVPALRPLFDDYHFIFYDQRGSLRSPVPDSTITLKRMAEDLDGLRRESGIDKVTIVAHSMGSIVAYSYLRLYPEHVKGLVLLGPIPPFKSANEFQNRLKASNERLMPAIKKPRAQELKEEGLDKENLSDKERTNKWKIQFAAANIYHVDRWRQMRGGMAFYNGKVAQAIYRNSEENMFTGVLTMLKEQAKPSYVIIGDHEVVDFGLKVWPDVARDIPNMELLIMKDTGHLEWIDQPDQFRDNVKYALDEINR